MTVPLKSIPLAKAMDRKPFTFDFEGVLKLEVNYSTVCSKIVRVHVEVTEK